MRLCTILKRPVPKNILNSGNIKKQTVFGGISSQIQFSQCTQINERTSLLNNTSTRQLSSGRGTTKTSDSNCENSPQNNSEHPTQINLSRASYTPVNLAYISYERKLKDKVRYPKEALAS